MSTAARLTSEEYIEQAYFFRASRQRLADGWSTQQVLEQMQGELLSTTRLPLAVNFMLAELKHSGKLSDAMAKLPHYFSGFQTFVVARAEADDSRSDFSQALLILEREAEYKSQTPTPPGLFVYQAETITRNQLGYLDGFLAMASDGFYDDAWRGFLEMIRAQLGTMDLAQLVYLRSDAYVQSRRQHDADYEPGYPVLFGAKEGRIAFANRDRDPNYFFGALQRQLGFPEVPRPPKISEQAKELDELKRKMKQIESKLRILEGEVLGKTDPALFVTKDK